MMPYYESKNHFSLADKNKFHWLHNDKLYSKPIYEFCLQTVYFGFDWDSVSSHHVCKHVKSEAPLIRTDELFSDHAASSQMLSGQTSEYHIKPEVKNQMFPLPIILCTSSQFSTVALWRKTNTLLLLLSERALLPGISFSGLSQTV